MVAKPSNRATNEPTTVAESGTSGSDVLSPLRCSSASIRLWGAAMAYPDSSMTVGNGPSAIVLPGGAGRWPPETLRPAW